MASYNRILAWTLVALAPLTLAGAAAENKPTPNVPAAERNGRYSMTIAPNGFLRLDTRTGAVSLCTVTDGRATCQSSADERTAFEAEIARLSAKTAELERKLAAARKTPKERLTEVLPSREEMDKALGFAEQLMRRMMKIMREDPPNRDRI